MKIHFRFYINVKYFPPLKLYKVEYNAYFQCINDICINLYVLRTLQRIDW